MCATHDSSNNGDTWIDVPAADRSAAAGLRNLTQPGSVRWKTGRWAANMWRRLRHRSTCCGHPGEPGC